MGSLLLSGASVVVVRDCRSKPEAAASATPAVVAAASTAPEASVAQLNSRAAEGGTVEAIAAASKVPAPAQPGLSVAVAATASPSPTAAEADAEPPAAAVQPEGASGPSLSMLAKWAEVAARMAAARVVPLFFLSFWLAGAIWGALFLSWSQLRCAWVGPSPGRRCLRAARMPRGERDPPAWEQQVLPAWLLLYHCSMQLPRTGPRPLIPASAPPLFPMLLQLLPPAPLPVHPAAHGHAAAAERRAGGHHVCWRAGATPRPGHCMKPWRRHRSHSNRFRRPLGPGPQRRSAAAPLDVQRATLPRAEPHLSAPAVFPATSIRADINNETRLSLRIALPSKTCPFLHCLNCRLSACTHPNCARILAPHLALPRCPSRLAHYERIIIASPSILY